MYIYIYIYREREREIDRYIGAHARRCPPTTALVEREAKQLAPTDELPDAENTPPRAP